MTIRSGADEVRAALVDQLRTNFDYTNVNGLVNTPAITQNPSYRQHTPCVYVYPTGQNETDNVKDSVGVEYGINVEVRVRYDSYRGGKRQAERIVDEVIRTWRGLTQEDYPTLNGYQIYHVRFEDVISNADVVSGAKWVQIIIPFYVSARTIPVAVQIQPVQMPTFTYSGWTFAPVNNKIERYDSGNIIPAQTYPSGNNGWDFTTASYQISSGAEGSYDGTTYVLDADDQPISIDSTINYDFSNDDTVVTSLSGTTSWDRIDSLRFGSINAESGSQPTFTDDEASTYGLRRISNWNVDYGNVTPHESVISITANEGQYLYIIVDHEVTLSGIRDTLGTNNVANYDISTVGDYKVYISKLPVYYDNSTFNYTLNV